MRATRGSVFDFAGTAALLAGAFPSVQCVFLSTSGYLAVRADPPSPRFWTAYERWHVARAWRVAFAPLGGDGSVREGSEGGREPMLVELHDDVAETIIRNEDLSLSEVDKVSVLWRGVCEMALKRRPLPTRSRSTWTRTSIVSSADAESVTCENSGCGNPCQTCSQRRSRNICTRILRRYGTRTTTSEPLSSSMHAYMHAYVFAYAGEARGSGGHVG